jgi:hypothetical protein
MERPSLRRGTCTFSPSFRSASILKYREAVGARKVETLTCRYNDDLSLEDAIHTALLTLKEGFEGQMTEHTIEIGVVTVPTAEQMQEKPGERLPPTFRKLSEQEVRDYLAL